ncbi:hypothetical protein Ancab_019756, partial [Ancistrocladus abbreviatus]
LHGHRSPFYNSTLRSLGFLFHTLAREERDRVQRSMTKSQPTTVWTREEDKKFKSALVLYDDDPNAWEKIATGFPGKSVADIKQHYLDLVDVAFVESLSDEDLQHIFHDAEPTSSLPFAQLQHHRSGNHNLMAIGTRDLTTGKEEEKKQQEGHRRRKSNNGPKMNTGTTY